MPEALLKSAYLREILNRRCAGNHFYLWKSCVLILKMCDTNGAVIIRPPETEEQKVFLRPYCVFSGISSLWDKS